VNAAVLTMSRALLLHASSEPPHPRLLTQRIRVRTHLPPAEPARKSTASSRCRSGKGCEQPGPGGCRLWGAALPNPVLIPADPASWDNHAAGEAMLRSSASFRRGLSL
jgi:hypothetical protein